MIQNIYRGAFRTEMLLTPPPPPPPPKLLVTACQRMYRPIWLLNLREKKN